MPAVYIHGCERPCTHNDKSLKVCQGEFEIRGRVNFELSLDVPRAQINNIASVG